MSHPTPRLTSPLSQPDDTAYALGQRLEKAWQVRRAKAVEKADAQPTVPGQQPSYAVAPADGRKPTEEEKAKRPSLTGALVSAYGGPFFTAALFKVRLPLTGDNPGDSRN